MALALLCFVGALELDEVRSTRILLTELETAMCNIEVAIALPDRVSGLGTERATRLDRLGRGWVCGL